MQEYVYKVVGVTFQGRQDVLKRIFDEILADPEADTDPEAVIRPYDYEGHTALAVDVAGENIGVVASGDTPAVSAIMKRAGACWVELAHNGRSLDEVRDAREILVDRRSADPLDVADAEELLEDLREAEETIYSATLHLVDYGQQAEAAPGPIQYEQAPRSDARPYTPDPPKAGRPGKGLRIARTIFAVLAVLDLIGVIAMQDASAIYTIFVWAAPAVLFHFLAKRKEKGK